MTNSNLRRQRGLRGVMVGGLALAAAALGWGDAAQAGDVVRPGGHGGGISHGGGMGSRGGGGMGFRGDGGVGLRGGGGIGGFRGGAQQFGGVNYGGAHRFAGVNPRIQGYGTGYRAGHVGGLGIRHPGWRYGGLGVGAGLALGSGLAWGASAYPYGYGYGDYGYGAPGYDAPDTAYSGEPNEGDTGYGVAGVPDDDGTDAGAWDDNGTHYTCSPSEKKTRLQRRACGAS